MLNFALSCFIGLIVGQQCLCCRNIGPTPQLNLVGSEICTHPHLPPVQWREKKEERQMWCWTKDRGKSLQLAANETSSWGFPTPQRVSFYRALCRSPAPCDKGNAVREHICHDCLHMAAGLALWDVSRKERLTYGQCKNTKLTYWDHFSVFIYPATAPNPSPLSQKSSKTKGTKLHTIRSQFSQCGERRKIHIITEK